MDYFASFTRYNPRNHASNQYSIQFGSGTVYGEDTGVLRQKFIRLVRES